MHAALRGDEVEIVARRGRTLIFVEVKARATANAAGFVLDEWQLRRVVVATQRPSSPYLRHEDEVRIVTMFIVPRRWPIHLAKVWQG